MEHDEAEDEDYDSKKIRLPQLKFIQQNEGSYGRNRSGNSLQSLIQQSNNSSGGGGADDRQDAEESQGLDIFQKSNRKEVSKQA